MDQEIVTPQDFKGAFLSASSELNSKLIGCWKDYTEYTSFFRAEFLKSVAMRLGKKCYGFDYYSIDAIFYDEQDTEYFPKESFYVKNISVAIEHENDAALSHEEIHKLQLFNASLKVLVIYSKKKDQIERLLEEFSRMIRSADIFGDFSKKRKQLVIIGSKQGETVSWIFKLYKHGSFVNL